MEYNFTHYQEAAEYILKQLSFQPEIAMVLGSCLGNLADEIVNPQVIDYKDIPNFLESTVDSHAGKLICGELAGKKVVCMSGRFHFYEGYSFQQLAIPMRVMKLLGVHTVILTNAAGGINTNFKAGDIMLIQDHIKLFGLSPTAGKVIPEFGPRFYDMSNAYDKDLQKLVKEVANNLQIPLQEGVYYYASGPQFETPAEIKAMRVLGADAVGMSTVTETITAAQLGLKVIGLSLISNMAAGVFNAPVTTEEVDETASHTAETFKKLVRGIVNTI